MSAKIIVSKGESSPKTVFWGWWITIQQFSQIYSGLMKPPSYVFANGFQTALNLPSQYASDVAPENRGMPFQSMAMQPLNRKNEVVNHHFEGNRRENMKLSNLSTIHHFDLRYLSENFNHPSVWRDNCQEPPIFIMESPMVADLSRGHPQIRLDPSGPSGKSREICSEFSTTESVATNVGYGMIYIYIYVIVYIYNLYIYILHI